MITRAGDTVQVTQSDAKLRAMCSPTGEPCMGSLECRLYTPDP